MNFKLTGVWKTYLVIALTILNGIAGIIVISVFWEEAYSKLKTNLKPVIFKIIGQETPRGMTVDIINDLRKGGHTIFIRHASKGKKVKKLKPFDDVIMIDGIDPNPDFTEGFCLNPQGRAEASLLGQIFRLTNIPVGKVYASPTCRTIETAQLAFGRVDFVDKNFFYRNFVVGSKKSKMDTVNNALNIFKPPPEAGKNRIIVTHGRVVNHVGWRDSNLEEAGMFIVKHLPKGNIKVVTEANLTELVEAVRLLK